MRPAEEAERPGPEVAARERAPEMFADGRGVTEPSQQQFPPQRVDERAQTVPRGKPIEVGAAAAEQLVGILASGRASYVSGAIISMDGLQTPVI